MSHFCCNYLSVFNICCWSPFISWKDAVVIYQCIAVSSLILDLNIGAVSCAAWDGVIYAAMWSGFERFGVGELFTIVSTCVCRMCVWWFSCLTFELTLALNPVQLFVHVAAACCFMIHKSHINMWHVFRAGKWNCDASTLHPILHIMDKVFTLYTYIDWGTWDHRSLVCAWCSQVLIEAVCGSKHPEAGEDRPATVVTGLDLDVHLPGPRPLSSLLKLDLESSIKYRLLSKLY